MSDGINYVSSSFKVSVGDNVLTFAPTYVSGTNINAFFPNPIANTDIISNSITLTENMNKILVVATSNITINFPSASLMPYKQYIIKNKDAKKRFIDGSTTRCSVTINVSTPIVLSDNSTVRVVNDGINWYAFNIR